MATIQKKRLGEILLSSGAISEEQLHKVLTHQKQTGKLLGELIVEDGLLTEEQIIKVLEAQLGIKSIDLKSYYIDPDAVTMVPENIARKYNMLGVEFINGQLVVAMKDPLDYFALEDLKLIAKIPIKQVIASSKDITEAIEKFFSKSTAEEAVRDFYKENKKIEPKTQEAITEENADIDNAPIVRIINSVIENSIRNNASDIHIEPDSAGVRIRIRIDGVLTETMTTALDTADSIIRRIKIMGGLNIAEKRVPQDGRISFSTGEKNVDLRVSTLPTTYGEKIVMRIMDKANFLLSKSKLGLSTNDMHKFDNIIKKPHGIILVTGPTGSGKSSTLYTILNELNNVSKNIITLEDPVEYDILGINQVQLNTKAGLTFATGLRSILRQDPDIVMVGEIRDSETAEIAIRAALTGHLVLSTLHTNDAPGAISRIVDMGIEPFLISSSIIGVIAQRLVRKTCHYCKEIYTPEEREKKLLSENATIPEIYRGKGCKLCNSGYKGRTAIFEIMEVTRDIRALIDERATTDQIRELALSQGMHTLRDSCKELVVSGATSLEEMIRVTYSE